MTLPEETGRSRENKAFPKVKVPRIYSTIDNTLLQDPNGIVQGGELLQAALSQNKSIFNTDCSLAGKDELGFQSKNHSRLQADPVIFRYYR